MLENFQLAAIALVEGQTQLYRIPMHQNLQNTLADTWREQLETFLEDLQVIEFDPGYSPEEHECFSLVDYDLPDYLEGETSQTVLDLDSIDGEDTFLENIKGLVAFAQDSEGQEVVLFQNFSRSHVIKPGRFLLMQNDTYDTLERPGITLGAKLNAVYVPAEAKLLFLSFRTVNSFLPLAEFYQEASEQDIREVLAHDLFAPEDLEGIAINSNQWFRKRFAMLRDSRILDEYTAQEIKDHSNGYELDIEIDQNKIVFPSERLAAKKLLQFLNEEIFRGAITETIYETNSKREAD